MPKELGKIGSFLKRIEVDRRIYKSEYKKTIPKAKKEKIKKYHEKIRKKARDKAYRKYGPADSGGKGYGGKVWSGAKKVMKELGKYEVRPYDPYNVFSGSKSSKSSGKKKKSKKKKRSGGRFSFDPYHPYG